MIELKVGIKDDKCLKHYRCSDMNETIDDACFRYNGTKKMF